jgi:hypothetical protein
MTVKESAHAFCLKFRSGVPRANRLELRGVADADTAPCAKQCSAHARFTRKCTCVQLYCYHQRNCHRATRLVEAHFTIVLSIALLASLCRFTLSAEALALVGITVRHADTSEPGPRSESCLASWFSLGPVQRDETVVARIIPPLTAIVPSYEIDSTPSSATIVIHDNDKSAPHPTITITSPKTRTCCPSEKTQN